MSPAHTRRWLTAIVATASLFAGNASASLIGDTVTLDWLTDGKDVL